MATRALVTDRQWDRWFYGGMAVAAAAIVFIGFSRTFYLREVFGRPEVRPLVLAHGLLFTSWIVLLLVQVTLVSIKRTDIHRRLGVAGGFLAATMVMVGIVTAIQSARRGFHPTGGPPALVFLVIPLFDMLMFAALVGSAFYFRRVPETHKRLMLVATIALLDAAIARFPFAFIGAIGPPAFFGLTDLVLIACMAYDFITRRRVHPAYLWGGLALIVSQPLRLIIGGTGAWMAFAQWVTR